MKRIMNCGRNIVWSILFMFCFMVTPSMALDIGGVWDSNWNAMTLWQDGSSVSGEYIYDKGVITGVLEGDVLTGWWREENNAKECGAGNAWSGPVVLKFSEDGLSFTGDWGYCNTEHSSLNPDGTGWAGTRRSDSNGYTQEECEGANRFWCNGSCKIAQCNTALNQEQCESTGRIWCGGLCRIDGCESPTTQEDCEISGKNWCNGACQSEPCSGESECTQEDLDAKYEAGRQACIEDPASCGISVNGYTKADLDAKYEAGFTAGKATCETTPPLTGDNCASFNMFTNILHIPCLDLGLEASYWINLEFQGNHLNIVDYGQN